MSLFLKNLQGKQILQVCRVVNNPQTKQCHWYPSLKPGPYPKTKEEREAAAKKYNLLPEEYEPYPDDGRGCGDYPKLPYESVDFRDPYYNWDQPQLRKNFMDPVPREIMHLLPFAYSPHEEKEVRRGALYFVSSMAFLLILGYFISKIELVAPVSEKQLIKPGVTHYSFEVDKGKH